MKNMSFMDERNSQMISHILAVAARLASEGGSTLSLAKVANAANVSLETVQTHFPKISKLVDTLYLELCRKRNAAILNFYEPAQSLAGRARSIWHGYVAWAQSDPVANLALNRLNLANSPSDRARIVEALNFPDLEVAERFAANGVFPACDPMYADAMFIAIVDTTVKLIRLHAEQESYHLRTGFLLVQQVLLAAPCRSAETTPAP